MDPANAGRELFHEYHSNESTDPRSCCISCAGARGALCRATICCGTPAFLGAGIATARLARCASGTTSFFCKLLRAPRRGGGVAHQDYSYWTRTTPLAHLTCWIGLDDSTIENGCLNYVPGSHKWPDLPKPVLTGEMDGIRSSLPDELKDKFVPVAIELKKGECAFHHARTMHGSGANDTQRPRRATVINVFRDGVMSNADEPLLAGVPMAFLVG